MTLTTTLRELNTPTNDSPSIPVDETPVLDRIAIRRDMVAGAVAAGEGLLVDVAGATDGTLTRGGIRSALESAGLPGSWAPGSKSDTRQMAHAVKLASGAGWMIKKSPSATWNDAGDDRVRAYRGRWEIIRRTEARVVRPGRESGTVAALVFLRDDDSTLHIDTGETPAADVSDLATKIREEYDARVSDEILTTNEVTTWFRETLQDRLSGAQCGRMTYIPSQEITRARAFVGALEPIFGTSWLCIPVARTADLAKGIASGFLKTVSDRAKAWDADVKKAAAKGKTVRDATARRLIEDLSALDRRADAYRPLTQDDERIDECIATMRRLIEEAKEILGAVSTRFSLLDLSPEDTSNDFIPADMGRVGRAADAALEARQGTDEKLPEGWVPEGVLEAFSGEQLAAVPPMTPAMSFEGPAIWA